MSVLEHATTKRSKFLKPPSASNVKLLSLLELGSITIVDIFTRQPIPKVQIKIFEDTTNKVFSYQSSEDGRCKVYQSSLQAGHLLLEHDLYYERKEIYGTNKPIDLKNTRDSLLALIKRPLENEVEFLIKGPGMPNIYIKGHDNRPVTLGRQ
jgi:hypothetical protein